MVDEQAAKPPEGVPGGPTLEAVLDSLGPTFGLLVAPSGLDVTVTRPIIHDPIDPPPIELGDVVLAVGIRPEGHDAIELAATAGASGAAALVIKTGKTAAADLLATATAVGVAVLRLAPNMAWGQAHTLIRTATAAGGAPARNGDDTGVAGDLFSLANAIAALVGGPTTIEDRESTVLAYSSLDEAIDEPRRQTILGQRVPEAWRHRLQDDGFFRRLWTEPGPIRIEYPDADPPMQPRLAIAVRAGDETLGSIWVAEGTRKLGPKAEAALREAVPVAALHLIRSRTSEDIDRERRNALLRSVLDGATAPDMLARALEVPPKAFLTVLAFRLALKEPEDIAIRTRRATDLISLSCESYRRTVACVAAGPIIYVLMPDTAPPDRTRLVALAIDVVERVSSALRVGVTVGIGPTVQGVRGVVASRHQADQVLQVLPEDGMVRTIEEVRPHTILATLRDIASDDPDLLEGKLGALAAHDHGRNTAYLPTLKAYLDAFGDVPTASALSNIHQNTFRYRLRRIIEIADIDLTDPVERLICHLQLHLRPPS